MFKRSKLKKDCSNRLTLLKVGTWKKSDREHGDRISERKMKSDQDARISERKKISDRERQDRGQ